MVKEISRKCPKAAPFAISLSHWLMRVSTNQQRPLNTSDWLKALIASGPHSGVRSSFSFLREKIFFCPVRWVFEGIEKISTLENDSEFSKTISKFSRYYIARKREQ